MHGIMMFTSLVAFGMIFWVGHMVHKQGQRQQRSEDRQINYEVMSAQDRQTIREIAERNHYQFVSYSAILDQFPSVRERHLRIVTNEERNA